MTRAEALSRIALTKIVPVVRAPSANLALEAAQALVEGGIDILEITMTVPGAVEVVGELSACFGAAVLIGAGTVMDAKSAERCVAAGARFIVSPALDVETVQACRAMEIAVAPGALTPTEIVAARIAGADIVKVFPCDAVGGPTYIKSVKGPFPDVPLMPTGGTTLETVGAYLDAGAIAIVSGETWSTSSY